MFTLFYGGASKMIKRILSFALVAIMLLSVTACSSKDEPDLAFENVKGSSANNSILFLQYSFNKRPAIDDIVIPDNYVYLGNDIYAVVSETNEIIGYKKVVLDSTTNKHVLKDCDANGKLSDEPPVVSTNPSGLSISQTSVELNEGETVTLTYITDPEDYIYENILWETSDENVATVEDGTITAVKAGQCTIKLTVDDKTVSCSVTVVVETKPEIKPESISLNKSSSSIYIGDTVSLKATISPNNADDKTVTWSSSDTSIATVNSNGTVTGKASGTATITAKTANGKTATCKVTVSKKPEEPKVIATTGISVSKTSLTLNIGENATITATVTPNNATNKNVTWTTSNNKVATVTNGKIVAVGEGTATITAKASGGQTATCTVKVNKKQQAFSWSTISQSDCPLSVSDEFDKYILSGAAKNMAITKDGYTYVMIKVAGSNKVSVTSVSESGNQIIIKTSNKGDSGFVFIRFNRENTNISYK